MIIYFKKIFKYVNNIFRFLKSKIRYFYIYIYLNKKKKIKKTNV